jgi:hypothetical protein
VIIILERIKKTKVRKKMNNNMMIKMDKEKIYGNWNGKRNVRNMEIFIKVEF